MEVNISATKKSANVIACNNSGNINKCDKKHLNTKLELHLQSKHKILSQALYQ